MTNLVISFIQNENERNAMAISQLFTETEKFDAMIVDVLADLRKKHKHADCESIHKKIVKIADFSSINKVIKKTS